jgi:hypothetical protein
VYSKTYGRATALATKAEGLMREGGNAMTELVDACPQVRVWRFELDSLVQLVFKSSPDLKNPRGQT